MQRQYWTFYWPLALTGLVMLLGKQFQNGVLASYEDPARELAVYAFACGVFFPFQALLVFLPQMANVLARSDRGRQVCWRFTFTACVLISIPIAAVAFSSPGRGAVSSVYGLEGPTLAKVVSYVRLMLPLILIRGMRQYYTGMLIQARRSGTVTGLHIVYIAVMIGVLLGGLYWGRSAVITIVASQVISSAVHLALSWCLYRLRYRRPNRIEHADLTYRQVLSFFWPMAMTSGMFAFSRPILYAFVNRTAAGVSAVAALRVAFDVGMIFHAPLNQFRNLFVTFGNEDLSGKRKFMGRVTFVLTAVIVLVAFTPLGRIVLHGLVNLRGEVLDSACDVLMVVCVTPLVIAVRNYFHGYLLTRRRTGGMAAGGIARVAAIYSLSWLLYHAGVLNHTFAAGILQVGFAAEAVLSAAFMYLGPASPRTPGRGARP